MSDEELMNIWGGAITASMITAIVNAAKTIFDLGKSIGSAIRRVFEKKYCQLS